MTVPKKPTPAPEAIDAFISGKKEETAEIQPPVKVRKKPVRMKEEVLRQTFVLNKVVVDRLEAFAFWKRLLRRTSKTKKSSPSPGSNTPFRKLLLSQSSQQIPSLP